MPSLAGLLVSEYGRRLYRGEETLGLSKAVIQGIQDGYRFLKPSLTPAWYTVRIWMEREPSELTVPCREPIFQSAVVLSLSWGWVSFARYLTHTFYGIHRGCETRGLYRADCSTPEDLMTRTAPKIYSRVRAPKTAWVGPTTQHSTIEFKPVVRFLLSGVKGLHPEDKIYLFSPDVARATWRRLLVAMGIPPEALPARSLRGEGGRCGCGSSQRICLSWCGRLGGWIRKTLPGISRRLSHTASSRPRLRRRVILSARSPAIFSQPSRSTPSRSV